jgi:putative DNA primase/helicase
MKTQLINATADSIAKGLKNATWRGDHWTASCPTGNHAHGDRSAGLRIAEGDTVPVVVACAKCSNEEIFDKLTDMGLWAAKKGDAKKRPAAKKPAAAPAAGKRALSREEKRAKPVFPHAGIKRRFEYVNADGEVVFEVWRTAINGEKAFEQHILVGGKPMKAGPDREERILYNLPAVLAAAPARTIFILEGEKDVDRATEMGLVATCNPGGSGKWEEQYSEALRGRRVVIVPDNDDAGRKHVQVVGSRLTGVADRVRVLELPGLEEKGDFFDWAEAGGTKEVIAELLKTDARDWTASEELADVETGPEPDEEPEPEASEQDPPWEGEYVGPDDDVTHFGLDSILDDAPFGILGYDQDGYYFLSHASQLVIRLSAQALTANSLMRLAPLDWWLRTCAADGSTKLDLNMCVNLLLVACHSKGMFDADMVRGRGAWWDDKRTVVHAGDRLFVNGVETPITRHASGYVYPIGLALDVGIDSPLTVAEAQQFIQMMRMMSWATPLDPVLAAGWCVCSVIGGVLNWRPHVWITGAKGSGKTWIMDNIIKPVLGNNIAGGRDGVVGATTAAGLRGTLQHDALPVVFDEAEGQDSKAVARIQEILELARASSSGAGKVAKGTPGGGTNFSRIRSCFAFSSINAPIQQQSDKSRIAVLEVRPGPHRYTLEEINIAKHNLFEGDYAARFFARAISKAAMVRDSASAFSTAAAVVFKEQRAGDQYGALLAGAWSLEHDEAPTLEEAMQWIEEFNWSETQSEVAAMDDARQAMDRLMAQTLRIDTSTGSKEYTVAELVDHAMDKSVDHWQPASMALQRHGMKVQDGWFYVANSGPHIEKLFRDTAWSVNWNKVLIRLPEAEKTSLTSFGSAANKKKSIRVPISVLTGED